MTTPACRVIGLMNIQDEQAFADYRAKVGETVAAHGGRIVFRGALCNTLWNELAVPATSALVELDFPSTEAAHRWANSEQYQSLLDVRSRAMVLTLLTFSATPGASPLPTVYYDGGCPLCAAEIATYRKNRGAEGLVWMDITQVPEEALGPGLTRGLALARMHVRRADGGLVHGAAAFAEIWKALPAWAWLGRLVSQPWVLPVANLAYAVFLRARPLWRRPSAGQP